MKAMEELITKSLEGDKASLEQLLKETQSIVYNLALRFVWIREDAEDATQEILIKITTNLSRFERKSKYTTWVYRIATNHLLTLRKNKLESQLSFPLFAEDLAIGLGGVSYDQPDKHLLTQEVKVGCTLGMLLCLDRNLRIAYLLGAVFEINSQEASAILGISPENFRKRLSLARKGLQNFLGNHCGLVNQSSPCRCHKRIQYAMDTGKVKKDRLQFVSTETLTQSVGEMEELYEVSELYRQHPSFVLDEARGSEILDIIRQSRRLLS